MTEDLKMAMVKDLMRILYNAADKEICSFSMTHSTQDNIPKYIRFLGVLYNSQNTFINNISSQIQSKKV